MFNSREKKPRRVLVPLSLLRPCNVFVAAIIILFVWLLVVDPPACLAWSCFAIWIFAEISALPPVLAAKKRGYLMPGENGKLFRFHNIDGGLAVEQALLLLLAAMSFPLSDFVCVVENAACSRFVASRAVGTGPRGVLGAGQLLLGFIQNHPL